MKKAFKERFYPTPEQALLLAKSFGCARFVYNNTLRYRTDAYYKDGNSISHAETEKRLVPLKKQFEWLAEVSSVILQQVLRDQQEAFKNFWEHRAEYPAFKKKNAHQSIRLTKAAFNYKDGSITIAKTKEPLNIRWTRKLPTEPSSVTISKDPSGRYFISMLCEFEPKPLPITPKMVGIDVGLTDLFVTSDGNKVSNPRHTKRYEKKLAFLQRKLSKKARGSNNRAKIKQKVARLHAKIADCRRDFTHKVTRKLINENQVVCVETLSVKNMMKHPTLAKHIADAGWGEFIRQLTYKAEWAGRNLVKIDRFFPSSKRCHHCGHVHESMPLSTRVWDCSACGTKGIDRDVNAARNILTAGLAGLASGATGTGILASA
jgi:putative transposase